MFSFKYLWLVSIHASAREATDGGDLISLYQLVSIHASAREATCLLEFAGGLLWVSIHASAREATIFDTPPRLPAGVSIHASAREATLGPGPGLSGRTSFNPRLRTGGDLFRHEQLARCWCFNPRLRTGGDEEGERFFFYAAEFQSTPPHGRRLTQMG